MWATIKAAYATCLLTKFCSAVVCCVWQNKRKDMELGPLKLFYLLKVIFLI